MRDYVVKREITTQVSDLSGQEIPANSDGGTVHFSISNVEFEIDLTAQEIDGFNEAIDIYVGAARQLPKTHRRSSTAGSRADSGPGDRPGQRRDPQQLKAIRNWARSQGHTLNDRGRIPAAVIDAFEHAHQPQRENAAPAGTPDESADSDMWEDS